MANWLERFLVSLLLIQEFACSLRILEVRVPSYVIKGTDAQLECLYELDGDVLYSIKWYKDGNEFYRYLPRDMPPAQSFTLPGLSIELHNSSDSIVTLKNVSLQSSGRYRCEVSGEAPAFETVTESANMVVVSLPDQGTPKIYGARPRYQVGDTVRANCSGGRSKPAVELSWFINEVPAEPHMLRRFPQIISGHEGLETTVLELQFRVGQHHFHYGDMKLKCVAKIANFYYRSNEESVESDRPQKAPVLGSRENFYITNSRVEYPSGHNGYAQDVDDEPSLRELFVTKILSFFIEAETVNKQDSMLLRQAPSFWLLLSLALLVCGTGGTTGSRITVSSQHIQYQAKTDKQTTFRPSKTLEASRNLPLR